MPVTPEELDAMKLDLTAKEADAALAQDAADRLDDEVDRVKSKTGEERVAFFWNRYPESRPDDHSSWTLEQKAAEAERLNDQLASEHREAKLTLERANQAADEARHLVAENEGRL